MNFSKRKSSFSIVSVFATALGVAALTIAALPSLTNSIARASGAGLDVEVPFEIKALKAPGLVAPYFLQDNHGAMVVSDQAGGVYSVTFGGKVTALADKTKIKNPSGVAIGPAGFIEKSTKINARTPKLLSITLDRGLRTDFRLHLVTFGM